MAVDSSTINGLLKEIYDKREIENLQNMSTDTWKTIKKSPTSSAGDGARLPINTAGNQAGQGSQNELEALRSPGNQAPEQFIVRPKIFTHQIRFSGLSMEIAKGNEESFASNTTFQMDEGYKDSAKELNQQLFRSGSGVVALVDGAQVAGATTIVFDNGVPTHFRIGEIIDIVAAGPVFETTTTVRDIDIATLTLTVDPLPAAISDNSEIYRTQVWNNAPADGKELAGLPLVTDDGTISAVYQGLDRTTIPTTQGITLNALQANLSNDLLQQAISRVKIIGGGRKPTKVISNTSQFRKYLDVVTPQKRFAPEDRMDEGYVEVPTWNGKEWIQDTDCGFGDVYILDPEYVEKFEVYDLKFDDEGGGILKHDPGFDAYYAYAKYYGNIGSRVPNAHVRITNLFEPLF